MIKSAKGITMQIKFQKFIFKNLLIGQASQNRQRPYQHWEWLSPSKIPGTMHIDFEWSF
jgi:hypothetical protein